MENRKLSLIELEKENDSDDDDKMCHQQSILTLKLQKLPLFTREKPKSWKITNNNKQ